MRGIICIAFMLLSGCSIIGAPLEGRVSGVIDRYCEEESPEGQAAFMALLNSTLAEDGHVIHVHCNLY